MVRIVVVSRKYIIMKKVSDNIEGLYFMILFAFGKDGTCSRIRMSRLQAAVHIFFENSMPQTDTAYVGISPF